MSWRTVVISNRCKLDLSMGYMVVRAEETTRVFIDEMAVLMIEDPAVSMTGCLLAELTRRRVRIIFCDEKRSPYAELQPYSGCHDCSKKIKQQAAWTPQQRATVWTEIVREKIRNQARLLLEYRHDDEAAMLSGYVSELCHGDSTNREGHAAKVYFNALFGKGFLRGRDDTTNAMLDYGYSILLSAFNREVTLCGYLTHIGLCHDNMFNAYNLSCDLMEPFRPVIDRAVVKAAPSEFGKEEKKAILSVLSSTVMISGTRQTVLSAIKIYTHSVFTAINELDVSKLAFYEV